VALGQDLRRALNYLVGLKRVIINHVLACGKSKGFAKRVNFARAKTEVRMASPTFSMSAAGGFTKIS
tara:strand:+ start:997 stop:1197 length:201 start_codon:yes stop_codon:yes gene_type:complete